MQTPFRDIVAMPLGEVVDHGDIVALFQQQPDCV
jgi:hypothetical protein